MLITSLIAALIPILKTSLSPDLIRNTQSSLLRTIITWLKETRSLMLLISFTVIIYNQNFLVLLFILPHITHHRNLRKKLSSFTEG